jgi:hypothetical protein
MSSRLKFRYRNWRGVEHEYVIEPESVTFGTPDHRWYLNGEVVTRDGDPRPEMGPTRRRSFHLAELCDVEELTA